MKKRSLIAAVLCLACVFALLLSACGEVTPPVSTDSTTAQPVTAVTTTQASTASQEGVDATTGENITDTTAGESTKETVTAAPEVPTTASRPTSSYAPEKTSQVVITTLPTTTVTLPPVTTAPTVTLPPPPPTTVPPVTTATTTVKPTTTTTQPKTALTPLSASNYHGYNYVKGLKPVYGEVYQAIAAAVEAMDDSVDLSAFGISEKELSLVFGAYEGDYPQHFWCEHSYGYSLLGKNVVEMTLQYNMTVAERNSARVAFNKAVDAVLETLSGNMSDYEKELRIHDALVNSIDYVYSDSPDDFTAYGALVKKKGVCEAYSRAFQYLCYRAGIQCLLVTGVSMNVGHMWNVVSIDDEWYHIDVTWDDPIGPADSDLPYYDYFNVSTKEILRTHNIDSTQLYRIPDCTRENGDYYTREGLDMGNSFQKQVVVRALVRFAESGKTMAQVASTINAKQFTDGLMADFWAIVDEANAQIADPAKHLPTRNASLSYSVDEDTDVIHFFIRKAK